MSACDHCNAPQPDGFNGPRCPRCGAVWPGRGRAAVPDLAGETLDIAVSQGVPRRHGPPPTPARATAPLGVSVQDIPAQAVPPQGEALRPAETTDRWGVSDAAPLASPQVPSRDPMSVFRAPTRPAGVGLPGSAESYNATIRSTQSMGLEEVQARVAAARAALDDVRRRSSPGRTPVPPPPGTRPIQTTGTTDEAPGEGTAPVVEGASARPSGIVETSLGVGIVSGIPAAAQLAPPATFSPPSVPPSVPPAALPSVPPSVPSSDPSEPVLEKPPAPWEVDDEVRGARITQVGPPQPAGPRVTQGSPGSTVSVARAAGPTARYRRITPAPRPPVLASDILREDLVPHEPGAERLRRTMAMAGVVLLVAPLVSGTLDAGHLRGWSMPGAVALLAGLMPLRYVHRAVLTLAAALPALALVLLADTALSRSGAALTTVLLAGLPTALLYRLDFRASRRARVFVGAGIALGVAWVLSPGAGGALVAGTGPWWFTHLAAVGLIPVLVLSLLAFMGSNTTALCGLWASAVVLWSGLLPLRPLLDPAFRRDGYLVRLLAGQALAASTLTAIVSVALASAAAVYLRPSEPQRVPRPG